MPHQVCNGIIYPVNTPVSLINALYNVNMSGKRVGITLKKGSTANSYRYLRGGRVIFNKHTETDSVPCLRYRRNSVYSFRIPIADIELLWYTNADDGGIIYPLDYKRDITQPPPRGGRYSFTTELHDGVTYPKISSHYNPCITKEDVKCWARKNKIYNYSLLYINHWVKGR